MGLNLADITTEYDDKGDLKKGFAPIPEGRYTVLVEEAKPGVSQSQNEKLSVTFTILDQGDFKGRKLWHDFPIVPQALVYLKQFLEAIKSTNASNSNAELKDIAIEIKNKKCTVWVETGVTNKGNPKNTLSRFKPLDAGDPLANETPANNTAEAGGSSMFK